MKLLSRPLFLYLFPTLAAIVVWYALQIFLPKTSFMYTFFFNSWPIQFLSTWLFLLGLFFWYQRFLFFKQERSAFAAIKIPDISVSTKDVPALLDTMPMELRDTLTLRRVRELLMALSLGEDVIRLSEELSRRDMDDVERGHLTLDTLKNLIPVIGFLGTVVGLSLAMVAFPQVTEPTALKNALRDFAASLSVAFNTTLLALSYTIAIIMLTAFLRQREETLISEVDTQIRSFILKIKGNQDQPVLTDQATHLQHLMRLEESISFAIRQAIQEGTEKIRKTIDNSGK